MCVTTVWTSRTVKFRQQDADRVFGGGCVRNAGDDRPADGEGDMAATRTLMTLLTAGLAAGGGLAQSPPLTPTPAPLSGLGTGATGIGSTANATAPPSSTGTGNPYLSAPSATGQTATGVLTATNNMGAPPTANGLPAGPLPPGSYSGPYCGPNAAGCNGPVGGNGPLTYELYFYTGPSFIVGGDKELNAALGTGWAVAGGGKTLHFNQTADAAWVLTTGITYLYSSGQRDYIGVATRPTANTTGAPQTEPVNAFRVKAFNRPALEFAIGRDWWLNGPAVVGQECGWNNRFGVDVGGRWGHNSISLVPLADPSNYFRRSSVFHAVTIGAHYTVEMPMGAWIGFLGGRVQWAYNWSNVVPPIGGNTQDVGLLMTAGVRF